MTALIEALTARLEDVLDQYYPGWVRAGAVAHPIPRSKADLGSMRVELAGRKRGSWYRPTAALGGGPAHLIAYALSGHQSVALTDDVWRDIKAFVGGKAGQPLPTPTARPAGRVLDDADKKKLARRIWDGAQRDLIGTTAGAYLDARGLLVETLAPRLVPDALRAHPRCPVFAGKPGRSFPALVARFTDLGGTGRAIQCTFVTQAGAKAPLGRSVKLSLLPIRGLAMRLLMPADGVIPAPCIIGEGVEDALTAGLAMPDCFAQATGGLSNLLNVVDDPAVSAWIVLKDNDWSGGPAAHLFRKALARLRRTGKPVEAVAAPAGKDFNDLLRGKV